MLTQDLHYDLPENLIAQHPPAQREQARLLVLDRAGHSMTPDVFGNIGAYLRPGDCLVLNDTRVIRARLHGNRSTGGKAEVFLLREESPGVWQALVRPSAKLKPGAWVALPGGLSVEIGEDFGEGRRRVHFPHPDVLQRLEALGDIPLPPYIHRQEQQPLDAERYQTVFARTEGAVAAPTAGLHYSDALLRGLEAQGIHHTLLTLHVGYGTFKPVTAERIEDHYVDPEEFELSQAAATVLNATRAAGGRVVAVGTTSTRVLETQFIGGRFRAGRGTTDKYIYPPYTFRGVDVLQTNFHLPQSSLLALVCAFAGTDFVLEAYRYAVREAFRFYSYGDTMLIV
jgi:S-adenosylmethionine:tRNA ribosyltransferase-isomerase